MTAAKPSQDRQCGDLTLQEDRMSEPEKPNEGELILYQTQAGTVRIEVLYESETFYPEL